MKYRGPILCTSVRGPILILLRTYLEAMYITPRGPILILLCTYLEAMYTHLGGQSYVHC